MSSFKMDRAKKNGESRLIGMPLLLLLLLTTLIYSTLLATGEALKLITLDVPSLVDPRSEKVALRCEYDLHGAGLYSVKWYKNDKEFFRYMPGSVPPGRDFEVEGVRVDVERSDNKQLTLLGRSNSSGEINFAGVYGCEVSGEAPYFFTDYKEANISVAVLPKRAPVLEGVRPNYEVGELLEAECTSAPSHPPATIAFLLNGRQVNDDLTRSLPDDDRVDGNVVSTSRLGFALRLERRHFPGGSLSLICQSTLPGITVARALTARVTATLAASNQRLAQEAPRSDSSINCRLSISSYLLLLLLLLGVLSLL